jgi:hypothetical protein
VIPEGMQALTHRAQTIEVGPVEVLRSVLADLATFPVFVEAPPVGVAQLSQPEGIAHRFRRLGIRGMRGYSSDCPLAIYLRTHVGQEVIIGGHTAAVFVPGDTGDPIADALVGWVDVPLPEPVAAFVAYFDGGQYPFLESDR